MEKVKTTATEAMLLVILGAAGALLVGIILSGREVFIFQKSAFAFLALGVTGAILFAIWRLWGILWVAASSCLLALVLGASAEGTFLSVFVHSAALYVALILLAHFTWNKIGKKLSFGRFVLIGLAFGVAGLVTTYLLGLAYPQSVVTRAVVSNALRNIFLGVGLGMGLELAEFINVRFQRHPDIYKRRI